LGHQKTKVIDKLGQSYRGGQSAKLVPVETEHVGEWWWEKGQGDHYLQLVILRNLITHTLAKSNFIHLLAEFNPADYLLRVPERGHEAGGEDPHEQPFQQRGETGAIRGDEG
jgi:hypothetical protein